MINPILYARDDFPVLHQKNRGKPLIYLDTAASAQKPQAVIDAIKNYYQLHHANVHRGLYELSERATYLYENARTTVQSFINAKHNYEIIFTKGATESINLVASSFGSLLEAGDEVILSEMEHHANIVPWQWACERRGAHVKVISVTDQGELNLEHFESLLTEKTRLIAVTHISNVLGTVNPVKKIIKKAHDYNIPVLVDGAQAMPHMSVDVQALDCDFYVFSSHKMYGPTGIGVLYGKEKWLEKLPPYQGGGDMIKEVSFEKTIYADLPNKFEAGTPAIASAVGLQTAMEYLNHLGLDAVQQHEHALLECATQSLKQFPELTIYGNAKEKAAVISFTLKNIHAHDVATILDSEGIAVRAGHHCAMPLMKRFQVPAMIRASFGLYNHQKDIDVLVQGLKVVQKVWEKAYV